MKKKYDIIWMDKVDSTNNEAARQLDNLDNLSVIAAREQYAGKGQRGNRWTAGAGENLTFSVMLRFGGENTHKLFASDQFIISEIAALSIIEFLGSEDIEARIKWPNDIYVGDRKICGILVENTVRSREVSHSIIGIGLNVNQKVFPAEIPNPTSMFLENRVIHDLRKTLEGIMDNFVLYMKYMDDVSGYRKIREMYTGLLYRKDELHCFTDTTTDISFRGIIRGIDDNAKLIVDTEEGETRSYYFKEIRYVIDDKSL